MGCGKWADAVGSTMTVADVLRRHHIDLSEQDIAQPLDAALAGLSAAEATSLSASETEYLADHAGPGAAEKVGAWEAGNERQERGWTTVASVQDLVTSTVSIRRAAQLLGIDRSRVSHRLSAGTLYAITVGTRKRLPTWQFHGHHELPGLAALVSAIQPGTHPAAVSGLLATSQDDLDGRTPIEHLISGGAAEPVASLLEELTRW